MPVLRTPHNLQTACLVSLPRLGVPTAGYTVKHRVFEFVAGPLVSAPRHVVDKLQQLLLIREIRPSSSTGRKFNDF